MEEGHGGRIRAACSPVFWHDSVVLDCPVVLTSGKAVGAVFIHIKGLQLI